MPCSVAWKQELEAVFWCVYVSLNDGCANLGIFWDALFFEKHFKASIRGAVHSLGQVQLHAGRKSSWHSNCKRKNSVAGLRFLNLFILE